MDGLRARCDAMLDRAVYSQICAAQLSRSIDWLRTAQHRDALQRRDTYIHTYTHAHTHADVQHTDASVMYFSLRGLNLLHLFDLGFEHEAPRGATATFSPPAVLRCLRYPFFFFFFACTPAAWFSRLLPALKYQAFSHYHRLATPGASRHDADAESLRRRRRRGCTHASSRRCSI